MFFRRIFLFIFLFFSISLFIPKTSKAVSLPDFFNNSENSVLLKIQEGIEYFFAFKVEKKVEVLEKHAEKRLSMAQNYAEEGNNERVRNLLESYIRIKERQGGLLGKANMGQVLGAVTERTIEQQKTMENIKTKVGEDGKQIVVETQEKVVNQVAEWVVVVNGPESQTEFFQEVKHVWAPGTGPGGEAGIVVEGGTMKFAPGTSEVSPGGTDIKTVVVESGGGEGGSGGETTVVESGGGQNAEPGSAPGGEGTTVVGE